MLGALNGVKMDLANVASPLHIGISSFLHSCIYYGALLFDLDLSYVQFGFFMCLRFYVRLYIFEAIVIIHPSLVAFVLLIVFF